MTKLIDQCYSKAIEVLKNNSTNLGFKASARKYNSIWARDGAITILGALLLDDKKLLDTSRFTLETLRNYQTSLGQIPNVLYLRERQRSVKKRIYPLRLPKKDLMYYATDANPWWIIGVEKYFSKTGDKKFLNEFWPSIKSAVNWLRYQVTDKSGLLNTAEASDWMDGSIGREGKVFYTNCLYYKAMECASKLAASIKEKNFNPASYKDWGIRNLEELKRRINLLFWPQEQGKELLWTSHKAFFEEAIYPLREHYINYLSFEYYEDRCDVLANILAILFEITDKNKQEKILDYLSKKQISFPYPVKVINPPIFYPNPTWNPKLDLYREEGCQNIPFYYHNAGIWPYVGGLYVLALIKTNKRKKAMEELEKLAEANKIGKEQNWEFNEWLHGKTGKPMGAILQSWNAASYIIAYQAVVKGKLLF